MTKQLSKYEKLLKEKYYPDPVVFDKEKNRIKESLEHQITYFEGQIEYYYNQVILLRKMNIDNRQQLKELS